MKASKGEGSTRNSEISGIEDKLQLGNSGPMERKAKELGGEKK